MATHDVASQVSLVVVVHGRRDLLARLLESIDAHTPQPHEVIVVDNCSPDDTVDWLRRHRPDVVVLEPGVNLGYGAGANLGVQAASGALVAVMNSDLEVTEGWLQPLVEALDDPDTAIAAPVTVAADDEIVEIQHWRPGLGIDGSTRLIVVPWPGWSGNDDIPGFRIKDDVLQLVDAGQVLKVFRNGLARRRSHL